MLDDNISFMSNVMNGEQETQETMTLGPVRSNFIDVSSGQALELLLRDIHIKDVKHVYKLLRLSTNSPTVNELEMPGAFNPVKRHAIDFPPPLIPPYPFAGLHKYLVDNNVLRTAHGYIDKLPEELLRKVFLKIPEIDTFGNTGLILTQVCRRWREVAFDVSELWSRLELTLATQPIHNPFYTLFHYLYHTNTFTLSISSPLMISMLTIFKYTITPHLQHRLFITHLHTLVLNGQGAIDALDSVHVCCENLKTLSMSNIQTQFPITFFQGHSEIRLDHLSLTFCFETKDALIKADLMLCRIRCRRLNIVWSAKWMDSWLLQHIHFVSVEWFTYTYVPYHGPTHASVAHGSPPLRILNANPLLREIQLKSISVWKTPPQFSRYLTNVSRMVFTDVEAHGLFSTLAADHEVEYFPSLSSLVLIRTNFELEDLLAFIHRITAKETNILVDIRLEGIYVDLETMGKFYALGNSFGIDIDILYS